MAKITGKRMRAFRLRMGWSQATLAGKLGVTVNTISRQELGTLGIGGPAQKLLERLFAEEKERKEKHNGDQ
jgi:transcriptional regulator with XRE-family HTH domain